MTKALMFTQLCEYFATSGIEQQPKEKKSADSRLVFVLQDSLVTSCTVRV